MICIQDCVRTKCLVAPNACDDPQNLTLATLAIDTDYTVYIEDGNNNVIKTFDVTSDGAGIVALNMFDFPGFFHPNTTYQLWVTAADAPMTDVENITQNTVVYTCFILEFSRISTDDSQLGLETQSIEVDA